MDHPAIAYLRSLGYQIRPPNTATAGKTKDGIIYGVLTYDINSSLYDTALKITDGDLHIDTEHSSTFVWAQVDLTTEQNTIDSITQALDHKNRKMHQNRNYRLKWTPTTPSPT